MKSRPMLVQAMCTRHLASSRALSLRPQVHPTPHLRQLSTSYPRLNETSQSSKPGPSDNQQQQKKRAPPPEENAPPQSPWKVFVQTLKEEIEKNQDWQDNVRQLQGDVDKAADSATMQRARAIYEKTRVMHMIKDNPRLQSAAKGLQQAGISVGDATARALQDTGVTEALERLTNLGKRFAQPVKDSMVGKAIIEALDDLGLQGFEGKETRRERRRMQARRLEEKGIIRKERVKANPEAGESIIPTSSQEATTSQSSFIKRSAAYQRFMENYYESDEPVYNTLRTIGSKVGRWFDENDAAKVIRAMREVDPDFKLDIFQTELKEYIVPEVVDAYLQADREDMKQWMSEASFNVCWATLGAYIKKGLVSDSRVMEIEQVDIAQSMFLDETVPVFLVGCLSQEVLLYRNAKTGEPMIGTPDRVERSRYVLALTRSEPDLDNPLTGGWKVVQFYRKAGT